MPSIKSYFIPVLLLRDGNILAKETLENKYHTMIPQMTYNSLGTHLCVLQLCVPVTNSFSICYSSRHAYLTYTPLSCKLISVSTVTECSYFAFMYKQLRNFGLYAMEIKLPNEELRCHIMYVVQLVITCIHRLRLYQLKLRN